MRANMEPIVYDAHLCLAEYYLEGPEGYDIAADFARQMMRIAEEAGSATGAALATLMLGEAELLAGHLIEAEKHLKEAAEANDREGCLSGSALARQRLAEAAVIGAASSTPTGCSAARAPSPSAPTLPPTCWCVCSAR